MSCSQAGIAAFVGVTGQSQLFTILINMMRVSAPGRAVRLYADPLLFNNDLFRGMRARADVQCIGIRPHPMPYDQVKPGRTCDTSHVINANSAGEPSRAEAESPSRTTG